MHRRIGISATIGVQDIERHLILKYDVIWSMFIADCERHIVYAKVLHNYGLGFVLARLEMGFG